MNQKITTIQRLSLIKYLYLLGIDQSYKIEPVCGLSILNFHDSVELFLQLSAEEVGVTRTRDINFMDYWDLIEAKGISLSLKGSMRKLNNARANLKHGGLIPSKIDIELFRSITSEFLEESCKLVFNIGFKDVSLVDYINFDKTRDYLKLAENKFKEGDKKETIKNLAFSFYYLLHDYEESVKNKFKYSPFNFGESMHFFSTHGLEELSRQIYECIDTLARSTEEMQYTLRILSFGLDYIKYIKFNSIIPRARFLINGEPTIDFRDEIEINLTNFEFCRDFIVESALKFQEYDFV